MRYRFIKAEKAHYPIALLCRCLQVARSGFYGWQKQNVSKRTKANEVLLAQVKTIYQGSRNTYGSPRIWAELRAQGQRVGKHRVARLLRGAGISALRKQRKQKTTDSNHAFPVAQNVLDRKFSVQKKNQVWVTDTTYVWTKEGWLYLAVVVDLFSRTVVGWATSMYHDRALVLSALNQAIIKRQPEAGLLHHSDQGSQYASHDYQKQLLVYQMLCSMSRKGNCWDNATAESFFATLKGELIYPTIWTSRDQIQRALFDYIEIFYNRKRRHSSLDYLSPLEYEQKEANRELLAST